MHGFWNEILFVASFTQQNLADDRSFTIKTRIRTGFIVIIINIFIAQISCIIYKVWWRPGGGGGYSGLQATGMIKGFFWV